MNLQNKKYYEHDNVFELYFGDSLKILKKLPDNSIDMIFADPPYFLIDIMKLYSMTAKN